MAKNNIFNKSNLAFKLYDKGLTSTKVASEEVVDTIIEEISMAVKSGHKVSLGGFGIFTMKNKAQSEARNPKTGEKVVVPAHNKIKFTASKQLKEFINK